MCLSRQEKFTPCRVGYKVFKIVMGELAGDIFRGSRPEEKWLDEVNYRSYGQSVIFDDSNTPYPKGWHVFHTRSAAEAWAGIKETIRKVKVRTQLATGFQTLWNEKANSNKTKVTVCKEIFILPEIVK